MAWNTRKPVIDFTSEIIERTIHFTGREWVFKIIDDWLANPQQSRFFLLKGEPGIGKTAISARLSQFSQGMLPPKGISYLTRNFLSAIHFCSVRNSLSIDPFVFTSSIATQLANRYPSYLKLLENVYKDKDVQINVIQHVQEIVSGQVIGVVINVSGPSLVSAFNRVVRQPLETLLHEGVEQIVILVDALDEALNYDSDLNIISLLAKLNNLSPRVRFLLTTRPDTNVEQELLDFDELALSAAQYDQSNQDDIRRYLEGRLKDDRELAQKASRVEPTCIVELMQTVPRKAESNFQYVRLLLDAMADGIRPLTELEGLPEGLDALYFDSLGRVARLKDGDWLKEGYARLVGILSVAQEPLTFAQLVAFTKLGESTTWRYLRDLWQFIEKGKQQEEEIYFLYHQSFIDFLRRRSITSTYGKKPLHNTFYLAANECHEMVANRCEDGGLAIIWEDMKYNASEQGRREYARRHYITHLYYTDTPETSAQGWKRLFEVLDAGQYGQAKIRYDPSMHLYAQDLDFGRKAAAWEGYGFEKRLALLPYLWRYTFLRCSLSSRVDQYPIELFQLLLLLQREQEVIGLAELVTNPEDKVKVLILVAEHLADQHTRKDEGIQIFLRAFNVASNIYDIKIKSRALRSVVEALVQAEQWDWAEEIAYSIEADYERARALCKLADALMQVEQRERAEGILIQAEEIAGTIEPDFERSWILSDLAKAWMQVEQWDRAEEIADCIESGFYRGGALKDMAEVLTQAEQWDRAEVIIRGIEVDYMRAEASDKLAEALIQAEQWDRAEVIAQSNEPGFYRGGALRDMAEALIQAEQWDRAEVIIHGIEVDYTRLQALSKLAHQLLEAGQEERAEKIWMQAEATARSIKDDMGVQALSKLAEALMQAGQEKWAKRIWKQAETVAFGIEQDYEKVMALSNLAVALVQAGRWSRAEVVASGIKKGNSIAERARKSEFRSFHDIPRDTEQVDDRSWAFGELAEALIQTGQWDRAEAIAHDIEQNGTRAWALVKLAGALMQARQGKQAERLWMQTEAIARNIKQVDTRAWVLRELAEALMRAEQWEWTEAIAHSIGKDDARSQTVEKSAEQGKYGVVIDRSYTQDFVRDGVLDNLVKALTQAEQWDRAEAVVRSFERDYKRDWALSDFANALAQAEQWERAEAVAHGIEKSDIKVKVLTKLAIGLVQTGQREHAKTICAFAEAVAHGFEPDNRRAQALGELAKALAQSGQWEQAEAVAYCIEESNENNTRTKVEALSELAIVLAQAGQWERAEALVRSIEEDYRRDKALDKIVEAFAQTERWERAEAMTCIIKQDYERDKTLSKLANALVQAGQWDRVEALVRNFKSLYESDKTLSELAKALVQAGQWERAEAVVRSIERDNEKDQTLGELAVILAQFSQWEQAEALVRSIKQDYERARALGKLAEALMRIGQTERAEELWLQAGSLARSVENEDTRAWVLCNLAGALMRVGQTERAEEFWTQAEVVVRRIQPDFKREQALGELAEALAQAGQWDRVEGIVRSFEGVYEKSPLLCELAAIFVQAGQEKLAEALIHEILEGYDRDDALDKLAKALVQTEQWERAEEIARDIKEDYKRAYVFRELREALIAGKENSAPRLLSLVQDSWLQVEKRAHALQLFPLVCSLIPLRPEIGTAFFEAFQWVDSILKG
jgi:tetratricopeptide (TPR) repeat protein/archaellum biogenesis ATPase FlaH